MMPRRAFLSLLCSILISSFLAVSANAADHIITADFKAAHVELINVLQVVDSKNPKVAIDVPADSTGQKVRMHLQATARLATSAASHRWAIFTLSNPDLVVRDFVLQIPRQGFANSGVLWPAVSARRVVSVKASTGTRPVQVGSRNVQSYALSVAPGGTASFAIELTSAALESARLWHRSTYEAQSGQLAFFNGVVLGIAFLLGVAILSLFVVRPMAVFPAASLFAWSMISFMLLNGGFLTLAFSESTAGAIEPVLRGVVESLMLVGLSLSLVTFLNLSKNAPFISVCLWGSAGVGVGLAAYSFIEPQIASGLARIAFALVVVVGFLTALILSSNHVKRAKASLLIWFVVLIWTIIAAICSLGLLKFDFLETVTAAGQGLILIVISFTLVHLVFGRSIAASHFLEDSGRRALALAGSQQSVWDWQVSDQMLYIGPELEGALGLEPGAMGSVNLRKWIDHIHPSDRGAYVSAVESAEKSGKGPFSQEFRLRRAGGAYRWFLLRARAITGEDSEASRLIGTLTDVTDIKRSEDRLLADAVRDRVTGLPNRALFVDRLERAIRRAAGNGNDGLFVLVIDLDRFKNVNDGLGHEVGDSLLNVMGSRLSQMIGPDDTLARLANDQFGIIFNGETLAGEIVEVADHLSKIIAVPINVRPREIFLTASIGIAQFELGRDDPEELIKNAEIALYEAKRQGKDMIEFFRPTMRDDRSQLVALESDLRRALERNEIEVVYQPIKRLVDGQLAGFEALVRWRHRDLGLLGPDAFMDIAEETGIIREVGRYVLNEAARRLGTWQRAFRPSDPIFVAVNVSRAQLLSYELVSDLRALLGREDIVPGSLKLEVTETLVMQNPELATKILERASDLGIGIACDDFGTGYSALANLTRLPFDTLKIDRAFLLQDGIDKNVTTVFDAITRLAHDLNLNVVAEGVETQEQLTRLQQRGVDYAQGFYIGEPVSAQRVIEALGGQPYIPEAAESGLSQMWNRLLGKEPEPEPEIIDNTLPTPEQQAAEIAEMQRQDYDFEPWSPGKTDVSDPGIADIVDVPEPVTQVLFEHSQERIEGYTAEVNVDETVHVDDFVLPDPLNLPESKDKPETVLQPQPSFTRPKVTPEIGAAPLAPRRKTDAPQIQPEPESEQKKKKKKKKKFGQQSPQPQPQPQPLPVIEPETSSPPVRRRRNVRRKTARLKHRSARNNRSRLTPKNKI